MLQKNYYWISIIYSEFDIISNPKKSITIHKLYYDSDFFNANHIIIMYYHETWVRIFSEGILGIDMYCMYLSKIARFMSCDHSTI